MNHHEHCNCSHDHAHDHKNCGCAHDHHDEGCGCGHEHIEIEPVEDLSVLQQNVLLALHQRKYLPVACFSMGSTKDDEIYSVALAPVYLGTPEDSMEQVRALGEELDALSRGGLITLDYDIPLSGYAYAEYEGSALYRYFQQTVKEASGLPGALFDVANLEKGSMALTDAGMERVERMLLR